MVSNKKRKRINISKKCKLLLISSKKERIIKNIEREKKKEIHFFMVYLGGIDMNNTVANIGALQMQLNALITTTNLYTEDTTELYQISQQLDELIVEYYNQYKQ